MVQTFKVLLIEDSRSDAALICVSLRDDPLHSKFEVSVRGSLADGLEAGLAEAFDIMILDLNLPDSDGYATFESLHAALPDVPVVVLTSVGGEDLAMRAVASGAQDFIFKTRVDAYWVAQSIRHAICRHALAKQLRTAKTREVEAAREANQARTDVLASMSHEIRSPLASIIMAADAMSGQSGGDDHIDFVGIIRSNGEHLLALINNTLDLSRIEAGRLSIESIPFHPRSVFDDVRNSLESTAARKGLVLDCTFAAQDAVWLISDPTRIRQILTNLVGNAIKFTSHGRISVAGALLPTADGRGVLRVEVTDSGIGIPIDRQRALFEAYAQADSSVYRRFGGSGLGLMLSKQIAAALGGTLELLRSEIRVGSTFLLNLPVEVPPGSMHSQENWLQNLDQTLRLPLH